MMNLPEDSQSMSPGMLNFTCIVAGRNVADRESNTNPE
jgi:hypothetical protein